MRGTSGVNYERARHHRRVPIWRIYVEGWQLECCGDPFAVGERVAWCLTLEPDDDDLGLRSAQVTLAGGEVVHVTSSGRGHEEVEVRVGDLTAAWAGPRPEPGQPRRGVLVENHHGGRPIARTATEGFVQRIRLVRRRYERCGERSYRPAQTPVELRDLDRSPSGFDSHLEGASGWADDGLLVELQVG